MKNTFIVSNSGKVLVSLFLVCFALVIFMPRGVGLYGIPFYRAAVVLLLLVMLIAVAAGNMVVRIPAPRTISLAMIAIAGYFLSFMKAGGSVSSLLWVVQFALVYMGVGVAFLIVAGNIKYRGQVFRFLQFVAVLLAIWACFEYIFQIKVFSVRNLYDEAGISYSINLRRLTLNGVRTLYSSLGPFASNLPLAGFLIGFSGFLVFGLRKNSLLSLLFPMLMVYSVMTTHSRAGLLALILVISTIFSLLNGHKAKLAFLFKCALGAVVFLSTHGMSHALLSIFGDVAIPFVNVLYGLVILCCLFVFFNISLYFLKSRNLSLVYGAIVVFAVFALVVSLGLISNEYSGNLSGRFYGMQVFFSQPHLLFLGAGPGAFFDSENVVSTTKIYSDQGSLISFTGEAGLIVGLSLFFMAYRSIRTGIVSNDKYIKALTCGLLGCFLTTLISTTPAPWILMVILSGLIESWSRASAANAMLLR